MDKKYINEINELKTVESVRKFNNEIIEACEKRINKIIVLDEAKKLSEKQFGYIKECFEAISPKLFLTNEGKNIIKKYVKLVKENKNLNTLHSIYENIRKTGKSSDIDFLIDNIIDENLVLNKNQVSKDVKKLGTILAEGYIALGETHNELIPEEKKELNDAVTFITENKKTIKNLSSFSSAVKVIREEIEKHETVRKEKIKENIDSIAESLLNNFNEKYNDKLTESEKKTLQELSKTNNSEEIFNKYKEMCVNKISEAKELFEKNGDTISANKLKNIFEQVSNKKYTEETILKDINNFIEISSILYE